LKYQDLIDAIEQRRLDAQGLFQERQRLIKEIEAVTHRPLIVYAAKLSAPREAPIQIDLEDVIGFSDLIADIQEDVLDVMIESPGGIVEAAERIVHLLRRKFKHVRFIVPGSAYSAATMLCLSGDEILMDDRSSLGPIEPQINGIPARSIINGFKAVREVLQKEGPSALPAYLPLIQKYDLHIFEICKDAEERGKMLVADWLKQYMLASDPDKEAKSEAIVSFLSDYDVHKSHSRPIFITDAQSNGLNAISLDTVPDLNTRVWELYIHIRLLFDRGPQVKIYENSHGVHWGRQFHQMMVAVPQQPGPPPPKK